MKGNTLGEALVQDVLGIVGVDMDLEGVCHGAGHDRGYCSIVLDVRQCAFALMELGDGTFQYPALIVAMVVIQFASVCCHNR